MTIYLYVKTHRKTGLKYLGKTEQDPYKYNGSGKYWKQHLKKHGYDVDTEIILECNTNEEIQRLGVYYSKLWNVVESDEWANLKEETGDGSSSEFMQKLWDDPQFKCRMNSIYEQLLNDPTYLKKLSDGGKKSWLNPENRKMQSERSKKIWENPVFREFKSKQVSERMSGSNHHFYDDTIYHFINDNGTEEKCTKNYLYTKYDLMPGKVRLLTQGKRQSHKGWRIKK